MSGQIDPTIPLTRTILNKSYIFLWILTDQIEKKKVLKFEFFIPYICKRKLTSLTSAVSLEM